MEAAPVKNICSTSHGWLVLKTMAITATVTTVGLVAGSYFLGRVVYNYTQKVYVDEILNQIMPSIRKAYQKKQGTEELSAEQLLQIALTPFKKSIPKDIYNILMQHSPDLVEAVKKDLNLSNSSSKGLDARMRSCIAATYPLSLLMSAVSYFGYKCMGAIADNITFKYSYNPKVGMPQTKKTLKEAYRAITGQQEVLHAAEKTSGNFFSNMYHRVTGK